MKKLSVAFAMISLAACSNDVSTVKHSTNAHLAADKSSPSVALRATDGTAIQINYTTTTESSSSTRYTYANDISIVVDSNVRAQSMRVVLMEICKNGGKATFQCDAISDDNGRFIARYPDNCHHDSNYDNNYYASFAPKFLIRSEGHGMLTSDCSQELAAAHDGVWLVDPISGQHNFKFKF